MTATVRADLSGDGTTIGLLALGDAWDQSQVQARLALITPDVQPYEGPETRCGALVPYSWAAVVQLGFSFNAPGFRFDVLPALEDRIVSETARRTSPVPPLPDDLLPPWLERTPRSYQLDGAAQIAVEGRLLLFDDPGTGKSATALLGLEARRKAGHDIFPMIIVVPSWEVGTAWAEEIGKWELGWREPVIHKGTQRHGRLKAQDRDKMILITTYATLRADAGTSRGPLVNLRAATVIGDELHLIKSGDAARTRAFLRIARPAPNLLGLTGTPVKHDTGDLHPMLKALFPLAWDDEKAFTERYCAKIEQDYGKPRILGLNPAMEGEFFAIIERNHRRVSKLDVLPELPPKIYSERKPDIPPEWARAYDTLAADMLARLPDGSELPVMTVLTQAMRLSQLASCAADVTMAMEWDDRLGMDVPKYHVKLKYPSWKAESLLEIAAERPGSPIVCFTASRQLAMITGREYCEPAGLRTGYVTGLGDGITAKTRQRDIDAFQAGKLDMIICTVQAGGTGITLTRSDCAVFLQRDWGFDYGTQPEDRLQRIGNEHGSIDIIDVIARGTVEDRLRESLRVKGGMLAQVFRDRRVVENLFGGIR